MQDSTTLMLEISAVTALVAVLAGYGAYLIKKPRHFLNVWTNGDGVIAKRLKTLGNHTDWLDPQDKSLVRFPLSPTFSKHAKNGGVRYYGDPLTGLIIRYKSIADPTIKSRLDAFATQNGLEVEHTERTGTLVKYQSQAGTFEHLDPKYLMRALNDGRIQQIARAAKGSPVWEAYILPALIIVGVLAAGTLYMVYNLYSRAGH